MTLNFETVLLYLAIISSGLFVLKVLIFSICGGDSEVGGSFSVLEDTDTSFNFLSIQSILAFLMGFGWLGLAAYKQFGLSLLFSTGIAVVGGVVFALLSAFLMSLPAKFTKVIKIDLNELAGKTAKAYTKFASNGDGQIEVELNGKLSIIEAKNNSDKEINSFTTVKIIKVENNIVYIEE